jgi:hypothetical protein
MMDKIVIAIHGIGSQRRSDTIRAVAQRFGSRSCPPVPVMPLGFFQIGKVGEVHVSRLDTSEDDPLSRIGFAEVFWADIPRKVAKAEDTLEESKAWGASVVSRARAAYLREVENPLLKPEDFALAGGVVEEIVEAIGVMENLLLVAEKAGVFKFDLGPLLRDYLGDVQIVAEFKLYRDEIVYRFHRAMTQIVQRFWTAYPGATPELYIVAHSEGTVVSLLGLLQALSSANVCDPDDEQTAPISTDWIQYVRGLMTIGSPIDKHIVLWPNLWTQWQVQSREEPNGAVILLGGDGKERLRLRQRIKWRNYYDFGDPIGFKLETAVEYLKSKQCVAFEFSSDRHDFGFSRYWLPGKAHNDYWADSEVFGHFIDDVVLPAQSPPSPPKSKPLRGVISTAIPYVLSFLLHFVAVFVMYKAILAFLTNGSQSAPLFHQLARPIVVLSVLLMGITAAARLPRLVKTAGLRWHVTAFLLFSLSALVCWLALPRDVAEFLGLPFRSLVSMLHVEEQHLGVAALLLACAMVALSGWVLPRKPRWARRGLVGSGAAVVLFIIVTRLQMDTPAPIWPLVLAGLAFVYSGGLLFWSLTWLSSGIDTSANR